VLGWKEFPLNAAKSVKARDLDFKAFLEQFDDLAIILMLRIGALRMVYFGHEKVL
jgi:hypothetical protein